MSALQKEWESAKPVSNLQNEWDSSAPTNKPEGQNLPGKAIKFLTRGAVDEKSIERLRIAGDRYSKTKDPHDIGLAIVQEILGSPQGRMALGPGKGMLGSAQLMDVVNDLNPVMAPVNYARKKITEVLADKTGINLDPTKVYTDISKSEKDAMEATRRPGYNWAGLLGEMGSPGPAALTKTLPALKAIDVGGKMTVPFRQKVLRGAATGGIYGANTPLEEGQNTIENRGINTGTGTLIGASIPAGTALIGTARDISGTALKSIGDTIRNFAPSGQVKLSQENLYRQAMEGGKPAFEKTVEALKSVKPLISKPSSAEAIAEANIGKPERFGGQLVRLQDELSRLPETSTQLRGLEAAQEHARRSLWEKTFGSKQTLRALENEATEAAKPYYKAVEESTKKIDVGSVVDSEGKNLLQRISHYLSKNKNEPSVVTPLKEIRSALVSKKGALTDNPQDLASLSKRIKEMLGSKKPTGEHEFNVKVLSEVKGLLDRSIEKGETAYQQARDIFREGMIPANQQRLGQFMGEKLTGPRGEERVNQFLSAIKEGQKTVSKGTGFPRYTETSQVFSPAQENAKEMVARELQREAMATKMSGELNIPGATSPVTGQLSSLPSPLYRPTMIANWIIRQSGQKGNEAVNRATADILTDPKITAEVLTKLANKKQSQQVVIDAILRAGEKAKEAAIIGGATYKRGER